MKNQLADNMTQNTNTTVTFEEWKHSIAAIKLDGHQLQTIRQDAAWYLIPVLAGFMTAPVGMFNNQTIVAKSVKVDDIVEFRAELAEMVAAGKQILLYMPIWVPANVVFDKIDPATFNVIHCDPPEKTEAYWKIRFAEVE